MSTNETASTATVLILEGELTIYRAAELKQELLAALEPGGPLDLDLSAVTELDTAGVQLLMLAKKVAGERELPLRLTGHSPAVLEVFELFNLGGHFGDPLVIGA
jgi:anti-sigma B factor antagonist